MRSSSAEHTSSGVLPDGSAGNSTPDKSAPFVTSEFAYHHNSNHVNPKRRSRSRRRSIVVTNETGSDGSASNPRSNRRGQGRRQAYGTSKVTSKGDKSKDTHSSQISTKVPSSTRVPHSNGYSTKEPKSYKTPKALKKEKQVHFHAKRATNSGRQSFGKGKMSTSTAMYQVREHFEKCEQLCRKRRRPRGHGHGKGSGVPPFVASGKMEKEKYHGSSRDFVVDNLDTKVLAVATERTGTRTGNALPKEFEDKDVSSGSYRSMGGKGGKDYSHRTHGNANVPREGSNGECCIGGVSFLKFRLHGIGIEMETGNGSTGGALTVGSHRSSSKHLSTNATGKGRGNNKMVKIATGKGSASAMQGDSSQSVVFVDCDNPCLDAPALENANCRITSTNVTNNIDVKEGDEVCLAVWNSKTREIEMGSSLPKVVLLTLGSMKTEILTSCASPIYPPYTQYFTLRSDDNDEEENAWIPFHSEEEEELDLKSKIVYLDGFSPGWVYFSQNMAEFQNDVYDYSFANCGCTCSDTSTSSSMPSDVPQTKSTPSQTPNIDREEAPAVISSSQPSPSELGLQIPISTKSPSSQSTICLETCKFWIESNCVLLVDGKGKCSETSSGGRLLSSNRVGSTSSLHEELVHHKRLVAAMRNLLQYLY